MKYKIYNQDVIEWSKEYQKGKFHALISDAPYHLTSIVKRFGKKDSAPAQFGTDGVFSRASKGFMGQEWDGGDVAFRPETWEAICEHLYPGAFGMVFSASRNWHRLAVAIEDAGMIIHPTIFGWLNGQGFPKATNISKQIQPASEQKRVGKYKLPNGQEWNLKQDEDSSVEHVGGTFTGSKTRTLDVLEPTNEMAKRWNGHRYGLQALKPAVEPIIVFQKPYEGRPLDNIVATGAGAINIDGGRIPTQDEYVINRFDDGAKPFGNGAGHEYTSTKVGRPLRIKLGGESNGIYGDGLNNSKAVGFTSEGRWPANFILDDSSAEKLDAQTGILTSGKPSGVRHAQNNIYGQYGTGLPVEGIGDSGGASRFFYNVQEQIDEADPIYYCSKVSPKERNAGLDEYPEVERSYMNTHNGNPDEGETWHPIDDRTGQERDRFKSKSRNPHPTLKPISLAKYLATLLLPPEGYAPRRILVPFSGVGSEMIGCIHAGWEHIVGIEFMQEYVELAEKRIEYWKDRK